MSKPDDIPQDVWDHVLTNVMQADLIGSPLGDRVLEGICRAVMDERDRCASIAASFVSFGGDPHFGLTVNTYADAREIANAIQAGKRP